MGDSDPTPSCLSAERHDPRDSILHYLGCLGFCERREYLNSLKAEDQKRIDGELRRIISLRKALKNERDDAVSSLVGNLEGSMKAWRGSLGNDGIDAVRTWRLGRGLPNGVSQDFPQEGKASGPYDPDNDVKACLVSFKDRKHVESTQDHGAKGHPHEHKMIALQRKIFVSELLMQPGLGESLKSSDRLLSELSQASDGSLNYLHFPANNMAVSTYLFLTTQIYLGKPGQWMLHLLLEVL